MRGAWTLILLHLLFSVNAVSQPSWTKIQTGSSKALWNIKFRTSLDGWAVGSKGVILHTTDGGQSWAEDSLATGSGSKPLLFFVEPQDSLNIWAGTWASPWFKSTDAGSTWSSLWVDSVANIARVIFVSPTVAFAAGLELSGGYRGRILKSTDGGLNWVAVLDVANRGFYDICFVDSFLGIAVGAKTPAFDNFASATLFRTSNGGTTWDEVEIAGAGPLDRVGMSNTLIGWAGGENGRLLLTTDGGLTWTPQGPALTGWVSAVEARSSDVWISPVKSDKIYHSTNSGGTWSETTFPTGAGISGLSFSGSGFGWAVGDSGSVWKYDPPTAMADPEHPLPAEFASLSNYPNPFNPSTKIQFSLRQRSFISLRVFDVLGRFVTELAAKEFPAGDHQLLFHAENHPAGVYLYVIESRGRLLSRKMVLVK